MKAMFPLLSGLALAACVTTGASVQTVDGMALQVAAVEDYYWPASPPGNPEIEVFPLVDALVVSRRDGAALTMADEGTALQAARAHCAELGLGKTGSASHFADGAWAFYPCAGG